MRETQSLLWTLLLVGMAATAVLWGYWVVRRTIGYLYAAYATTVVWFGALLVVSGASRLNAAGSRRWRLTGGRSALGVHRRQAADGAQGIGPGIYTAGGRPLSWAVTGVE